jgi:hypothetical protein
MRHFASHARIQSVEPAPCVEQLLRVDDNLFQFGLPFPESGQISQEAVRLLKSSSAVTAPLKDEIRLTAIRVFDLRQISLIAAHHHVREDCRICKRRMLAPFVSARKMP